MVRRIRKGGRSDSAPGRGGLRRRGGISVCYREDSVKVVIGKGDVEDTEGEVVAVMIETVASLGECLGSPTRAAVVRLWKAKMGMNS